MYGYKKEFKGSLDEAYDKTTEELKKEGFGVLTEIDVKAVLKEKLGENFNDYKILGACNPAFALKALNIEKEMGLLMPCNVIIFEDDGKIFISSLLPTVAMNIVGNQDLEVIAKEVEEKLKRVIDAIVK